MKKAKLQIEPTFDFELLGIIDKEMSQVNFVASEYGSCSVLISIFVFPTDLPQ